MLSTPVWGVEIKNEVVAAVDAPLRRNDMAVGSTPHEHSGKGTPINAAFIASLNPLPERWRVSNLGVTNAWRMPQNRKPNSM
jgi:hypothetical protein